MEDIQIEAPHAIPREGHSFGRLGEVGKNITCFEYGDDIILVDVGLGFPTADMYGVDLVIPDITYLQDKLDRIRAIFLTHGHEDHIGALPYLLPQLGVDFPLYCTRLTAGLVRVKLKERKLVEGAQIHVISPDDVIEAGAFKVEFFRVSHSVPDGVGLAITSPAGLIVHTGDFKFDQTPVDGKVTEFGKLAEIGNRGVDLLMSDCVHVESPGMTPSEAVVTQAFDQIFRDAGGRIIVATFASLISRVQQVLDAAYKYGRKVAPLGRSLENNVAMARDLGYLDIPENTLIKAGEAANQHPLQVAYVVTGAQGEPMAVLSRIANKEHKSPFDPAGRHRDYFGHAHSRQRNLGWPDYQQPGPAGRERNLQRHPAGPRFGPRQPGRTQTDDKPGQAALRDANSRRTAPPGPLRQAGPGIGLRGYRIS